MTQTISLYESFYFRFVTFLPDAEKTLVLLRKAGFSNIKSYDMHKHNATEDYSASNPKVIFEVFVSDVAEAFLVKQLIHRTK